MTVNDKLTIVLKRTINASRIKVFDAWIDPRHLLKWWGPKHVSCIDATVDLRVGGKYRIANKMPDDSIVWITGEYQEILVPEKLVFSWQLEGVKSEPETVTVKFNELNAGRSTEVTIIHAGISNQSLLDQHEQGWTGCLDGLKFFLDDPG